MQQEDIERFADTLANGFSEYSLFKYICNGKNVRNKMRLFWAVSLALVPQGAICIADSKEANSVLIYVRPNSKEPGLFDYLRTDRAILRLTLSTVLLGDRQQNSFQDISRRVLLFVSQAQFSRTLGPIITVRSATTTE